MDNTTVDALYLLPPEPQPHKATQKAYKGLSPKFQGTAVPWNLALSDKAYKSFQRDRELYQQQRDNLSLKYYNETFIPTGKVFEYMCPAKINLSCYERYASVDTTGHIHSFIPNSDGYANCVDYSRISTTTGRLKTIAGPMLLHLPKIYRGVLESRWSNGVVLSLDYNSLEPRVLLSVSGTQPVERGRDIYETIRTNLFPNNQEVSRSVVKKIVLSEIYGAGINTIREQLPNVSNLHDITQQIKNYFNLDPLLERLQYEWKTTGNNWIENFYGRRVKTTSGHTLINHYIQSTAVDVAMLGFKNLLEYVEQLGRLEDIVPLFVLHDALILDINPNAFSLINGLAKVGGTDIKGLENTVFFMSVDKGFTKGAL